MYTYPGYLNSLFGNIYNIIDKYLFDYAIMDYIDAIYTYSFDRTTILSFEIVCSILSMIASIFVIAIPFAIVWRVIKLFVGR